MRLMPARHDPDRVQSRARSSESDGRGSRRRNVRFSLRMRDLSAKAESNSARGGIDAGEENMIAPRRTFLRSAALSGAALVIGFDSRRLFGADEKKDASPFKPNGWVRIDGDGKVTLTIGKSEMGQGVRTSLAMILADELGADWSRIKIVQASPSAEFKDLGTGGSGSMEDGWPMRKAAAAARAMLTTAAATRWRVPPNECKTEHGAVMHEASGRRLEFTALVADAAKLHVPTDTPLKTP